MKTVLLAGFGPYGPYRLNPGEHVARLLNGQQVAGCPVTGVVLPVSYARAGEKLLRAVDDLQPDAVLVLELAPGLDRIALVRVAINCDDGGPDADGATRQDAPIVPGGPPAYFGTLPVRRLVDGLIQRGYPADIADAGGTFVGNHAAYCLLHHLNEKGLAAACGLVQLPATHEMAASSAARMPSWSMASLLEATRILIQVLAQGGGRTASPS
ncbi:pyroglutamyl-peptidase I [Calditerricola satsumensis]|uniref:Pyrrolidone-carboxylate peptidase n=1 Tax=Calditerricola satsumensis TaxID=373054 RepID=A0A8J3BCV4_9BACI|nr:hypothetical protein [Calditerricola satsumensis]GGK05538.1 pyrrolidone-carboxylate peptidase [Calditerricola satsumensis]